MGLIADTCIFIKQEKQDGSFNFGQWGEEIIYISAITASELLVGMYRADNEARRIRRTAFIDAILAQMPILDFTLEVARIHAELYAHLAKQGNMIGSHDLIIAATALAYDCTLLTANQREFSRVPGLKLANF